MTWGCCVGWRGAPQADHQREPPAALRVRTRAHVLTAAFRRCRPPPTPPPSAHRQPHPAFLPHLLHPPHREAGAQAQVLVQLTCATAPGRYFRTSKLLLGMRARSGIRMAVCAGSAQRPQCRARRRSGRTNTWLWPIGWRQDESGGRPWGWRRDTYEAVGILFGTRPP